MDIKKHLTVHNTMVTLEEGLNIIYNLPSFNETENIRLKEALGRILAEDIFSDMHMPPFDKSAMDGFACREEDLNAPLKVIDYIPAGIAPKEKITAGTCAKIMTGAMVPEGADSVIMVEHTEEINENTIRYTKSKGKSNICYLGEDIKEGDKVLDKGEKLKPSDIAVLASVGISSVKVSRQPKVVILPTGDELVEPDTKPSVSQIRNSNAYNLIAQLRNMGIEAIYPGIVQDKEEVLQQAVESALKEADLVILTGGVSMGDKDFVPGILKNQGMQMHFDKILTQPGRPIAFASGNNKYCFGLAGNPVSTILQFEILVKTLIYQLMGHKHALPLIKTKITKAYKRKKTDRLQFFPVTIENGFAAPIEYHGSAHIAALTPATALGLFPIGEDTLDANTEIEILML